MALAPTSSTTPAEALAALLGVTVPVGQESVPIAHATGRVLAQPVLADRPSPSMDVSAMDGFALRLSDAGTRALPIAAAVGAGEPPVDLPPHSCVRIATGAPVPTVADLIVPVEHVREEGNAITIHAERAANLKFGAHIRRKGENSDEGACVLFPGAAIHAPAAAAIAAFGIAAPLVYRRVRIATIITGDEVRCDSTETVRDWTVRDSNGPALRALLAQHSWVDCAQQVHVGDSREELTNPLDDAIRTADLVIVTGGLAVGHRDFVSQVLDDIGAQTLFHGVAQRPARPLLGAVRGPCPIVCLPGNPVSVMISARRYALPLARKLGGFSQAEPPSESVRLIEPPALAAELTRFLPVRRISPGWVRALEMRGSGDAPGCAASNGFVEIPPGGSGEGPWNHYDWN